MSPITIVILFHKNTPAIIARRYTIARMAKYWKEDGHIVKFLFGPDNFLPADICIVHVDLSVVPDQYIEFANRYPKTINAKVRDIRKSTISKNILAREDEFHGPVIVKSDLNYAGWPEQLVTKNIFSLISRKILHRVGFLPQTFLSPKDYRVYEHLDRVPDRYFDDDFYIVEKYLPQREGETYYTNLYVFFGTSYHCFRLGSASPIVYSGSNTTIEVIEPHAEIVAARHRLNFDYGKFDYAIHDGKPVLFDTNKLIGMSSWIYTKEINSMVRARGEGLYSFFD